MEYEIVKNGTFNHGAVASGTWTRDLQPQGHLVLNQSESGTSMDAGLGRWIGANRDRTI
jgi:hypothetical protein